MSYSCLISFKKLKPEEVFPFLQEFKKKYVDNIEQIVREEFVWSPLFKTSPLYEKIDPDAWDERTFNLKDKVETWLSDKLLKFRWFYFADKNILGVYGVDKSCQNIFDNTTYFQNSTDQDYEYEIWDGIDIFEKLRDNWKDMSKEDILKLYPDVTDFDYFRKTKIYEVIWKMFEDTLEDDNNALYLSMLGYWDFQVKRKAWNAVVEKYNAFIDMKENKKDKG